MSISNSLSNALSGMNAASRMAEIVSSNVSNSMTDGYGRRSLNLSSAVVGGRGAGVEIGSVNRHVDRGILSDRRLAGASLGGFGSLVSTLNRIQDTVGQAGDSGSISARIVAVESALIDAASDPASTIRLSSLVGRLSDVAASLNASSGDIQAQRAQADTSIAEQVSRLNMALAQVERFNVDISYSHHNGFDPSGLLDQRQRVIDVIAEIVPVRELDRDGGQVALMTPNGETLIDGAAKVFGFTRNAVIVPDMTLAGGTLGASFQARDGELVNAQEGLDNIAADLILRFQNPAVDPTLAVGQAGILTDGGVAFEVADTVGLAGRITLNAAVDPAAGGVITNLRDGINATMTGPSGNASLLQSLSAALSSPVTTFTDPVQQGAASRAASFEAELGNRRLMFESEVSFANTRWSSLKEAEAAGGVDTDYEMQMLLRVEQAYAANARVVQTVESLMQRLLEI